ncbi:MAG: glutathione S-transferase family protein [Burkholderiaceae bacterium]
MTHEMILHHYDGSPYSEKIRLLFGYKQLEWHSVSIPPMLPKPGLMALTNGYRRAPVLQIGADIYCDSALIAEEIDRRFPSPANAGGACKAIADLLSHLIDVDLFWRSVRYVMGMRAEQIPQAMLDDRQQMHPQINFDRSMLTSELPRLIEQLRPVLGLLDAALVDNDFFGGKQPAIGDFGLYHPLWFLQSVDGLSVLAPHTPKLHAWLARMATFGKGRPMPMSQEEAIDTALRCTPAPLIPASTAPDMAPGSQVAVMPSGYPREAVRGRLVHLDELRVVIAHESAAVGLIHVHFPRLGYVVQTGRN